MQELVKGLQHSLKGFPEVDFHAKLLGHASPNENIIMIMR